MNRKGFTLIELVMAMMATGIVMLAIGVSLAAGIRFWGQTISKSQVQRDTAHALQVMRRSIQGASSATVSNGGSEIQVQRINGAIRFGIVDDTLLQTEPNQPSQTILEDVTMLTFNQVQDAIGVTLEVQRDVHRARYETSILMRNTGGS